jgi:hypothetical protein
MNHIPPPYRGINRQVGSLTDRKPTTTSTPHPGHRSWDGFVRAMRAQLTADEHPAFDRAVAKLTDERRQRLNGLSVEQAVAAFRNELGIRTR